MLMIDLKTLLKTTSTERA